MKKSWLYGCSFILLSIFATACGDDEKDIYGIFYADIVTISPVRQPIPLRSIRFIPFRK